ncbi:MAG: acyl-CoA dehydrogenase, partial [Rhizobiales bacterium]|nr:acyl-CoA dehydrogenase [Hyphomicrobiales bacterium]
MPTPRHDAAVYRQIRDTAARFADEVVRPAAGDLDRDQRFPGEIYREMARLGLFGITLSEEDGGAGLDVLAYAVVMEELSRGYASVADQCGLVELIATLLARHGTAAQKAKYLAPLVHGRWSGTMNLTEPQAGSDVGALRTRAVKNGEHYRLTGQKI